MFFSYFKNRFLYISILAIFLLLILFLRIYLNSYLNIPLHFDEAQYWSWSKDPAWGYFSKPPMLAWIISISNYFCGNTEPCIRVTMPILYYMSTIFFIFFSTKIVTQNKLLSAFAAVIFNLIPGITFSSFVATTDVPLIFFSSGFTFYF